MNSFKLLVRLFKVQCTVEDNKESDRKPVLAKPNKDIASDSLQNPSDPDAGYCGDKGKGCQVQVSETCNPDSSEDRLFLITSVNIKSADRNDTNGLLPALGKIPDDSFYGGDENYQKAKEDYGVDLMAPIMEAGNKKGLSLDDCGLNKQGEVISCPHIPQPLLNTRKRITVLFLKLVIIKIALT